MRPKYPEVTTVCRGCGGTGLDHGLTPRQVQMVRGIFYCHKDSVFNNVKSGQVASLEIVPVDVGGAARLSGAGPLSYVLELIEHYFSIGYYACDHDVEELKAMACDWCNGTGVPQLSPAYMQLAVKA